jgi:hypothetical protein
MIAQQLSFKKISVLLLTITLASLLPSVVTHAGVDGWNAGNIIDDSVFTDRNSMGPNQIQEFLNSKVPVCDTNGSQPSEYGGGTRAQWGQANYGQSTFVCLRNYSEGGRSAAQIIYDTAQRYAISPKVLLVLLQKEQGLVTDTWPLNIQYRTATGYGCPDTAPCDSQYYGLSNQLDWSGKMFRAIMDDSPTWYTPYELGNNFIRYSPDSSCGGSTVNIQNRATQALYNYTPYQPNQAALNAGWGTAPCGAYGNRNFYLYFTSWFGSTHTPPLRWEPVQQNSYTDSSKTVEKDIYNLRGGERIYNTVRVKNVGTYTWYKGGVSLGTSQPQNRSSIFKDWTWPSTQNNRTGTFNEDVVAPGQIATFDFWTVTPSRVGEYWEFFNLITSGGTWMNDMGLNFKFRVRPPVYSWAEAGKAVYTDASKDVQVPFGDLQPNTRYLVSLKALNTGNLTWQKSAIQLGTWLPVNHPSLYKDWTWPSTQNNRAGTFNEDNVAPGETATFDFWIHTPGWAAGWKPESFNLIVDNNQWMPEIGQQFPFAVNVPHYGYKPIRIDYFTDSSKSTPLDPNTITKGTRFFVSIKTYNTGSKPWSKNQVLLGTSQPQGHPSIFKDWTWPSTQNNRAGTITEDAVPSGGIATFDFWMLAPNNPGIYSDYFDPLIEYVTWFTDMKLKTTIVAN